MADIVCPLCGTTYEGLNLDETNGWFICTKYDIDLCLPGYGKKVKIPIVLSILFYVICLMERAWYISGISPCR